LKPSEQPSQAQDSALSNIEFDFSTVRRRRRRTIRILSIILALLAVIWFVPPVYKLLGGSVTVTRWDRKLGETQAVVGPGRPGWIKASAISRHVLHAFVAAEDGKFYYHSGFDVQEIARSIQTNLKKKRYARGASTISQQVVKMAFLSREKSMLRKAREAVGTILMETILSKEKILEWYINLAEFGDGVYGIREGCQHYFKTKPEQLTIEQSVHLALVLPSPNSWSRGLRSRSLTPFGHKRFASILNNMKLSGYITKSQWQTALSRGDFGRPIHGYTTYLANEDKLQDDCTAEGCGDVENDPLDEVNDVPPVSAAQIVPEPKKPEVTIPMANDTDKQAAEPQAGDPVSAAALPDASSAPEPAPSAAQPAAAPVSAAAAEPAAVPKSEEPAEPPPPAASP
jgi:monofunctional biosynthetic peptidoglycan transglycosylase